MREWKMKISDTIELICSEVHWGLVLEYVGDANDLLSAKCISKHMVEQIAASGRGRLCVDEDGRSFRRQKAATKAQPNRIRVIRSFAAEHKSRRCGLLEDAYKLPGVAECIPRWSNRFLSNAENREPAARRIGRSNRLAKWSSCGKVIQVDWTFLKSHAAA